ncbi:MAG: Ycf66 family protein [Hormoscilla sp.]
MAYILALAIGMGSLALYTAAFFFPEVYRKGDFFWSGVGMFYALILWFCAGRITGAVLLGQLAAATIVLWFGWENLRLRRYLTPVAEQTQIKEDVKEQLAEGLSGLPKLVKTGLKKDEESTVAPSTTPDGTAAQAESQLETDSDRAPEKIKSDELGTTEAPQTDDASQSQTDEVQSQTDEVQSQTDEAESQTDEVQSQTDEAQSQTDESRDANASAEALRKKESEPVKPEKQKSSGFLGLGKIFASVKSRSKKQRQSQPDQKITSSDSVADETAETPGTTTSAPVPDVTTSQTSGSSVVETEEAITPLEQTTVPEVEETPGASAVESKEAETELEQAAPPETSETSGSSAVESKEAETELEQAAPPQTEETLTGSSAVEEGENESSPGSAEIKAKTDES